MKYNHVSLIPAQSEWTIMREMAITLVKSGFLPTSIKTAEAAMAVMLKGRELNVPAMQAFSLIHIIQGKPCVAPELMLALIFRNVPGAVVNILETTAERCLIEAKRPGGKLTKFNWTMEDAKKADLLGKDNWRKYPRAMLRSRNVAETARSVFPDAIMGCSYTPEEMGAEVNEDGEVELASVKVIHSEPEIESQSDEIEIPFGVPVKAEVLEPAKKTGSIYTGTEEQQKKISFILGRHRVPEEHWEEIHQKLRGRPSTDVYAAINEVRQSH